MTEQKKFARPKVHGQAEQGEDAFNAVDIADRLYDVMAALSVISGAVAGSEIDRLQGSGLRMILFRQIDEIRTLKTIIHPPKAERYP